MLVWSYIFLRCISHFTIYPTSTFNSPPFLKTYHYLLEDTLGLPLFSSPSSSLITSPADAGVAVKHLSFSLSHLPFVVFVLILFVCLLLAAWLMLSGLSLSLSHFSFLSLIYLFLICDLFSLPFFPFRIYSASIFLLLFCLLLLSFLSLHILCFHSNLPLFLNCCLAMFGSSAAAATAEFVRPHAHNTQKHTSRTHPQRSA